MIRLSHPEYDTRHHIYNLSSGPGYVARYFHTISRKSLYRLQGQRVLPHQKFCLYPEVFITAAGAVVGGETIVDTAVFVIPGGLHRSQKIDLGNWKYMIRSICVLYIFVAIVFPHTT
jgi:hypothetical protein